MRQQSGKDYMHNFSVLIDYFGIYGEEPKPVEYYLSLVPKSVRVELTIRLLTNPTYKKNDFRKVENFVAAFFSSSNTEFKKDFAYKFISNHINKPDIPEFFIFSDLTGLTLLNKVFSIEGPDVDLSETDTEINYFRAILAANYFINLKEKDNIQYIKNTYPNDWQQIALIDIALSYWEFEYYDYKSELEIQIFKGITMFEFLKSDNQFSFLYQEFCNYFNIQNYGEYYQFVLNIINNSLSPEGLIHNNFIVKDQDNLFVSFLKKLDVNGNVKKVVKDFSHEKTYPLYVLDEKESVRYYILFFPFLFDKLYKSLYFTLNDLNAVSVNKISEFRSVFTSKFSEKVLLNNILDYMFKDRYPSHNSDLLNLNDISIDYVVRNGNDIYLFEYKDYLLSAKVKEQNSFAALEKELKKKFVQGDKGNKGVRQLVQAIKELLTDSFRLKIGTYKRNKIKIHPVLVVQDRIFDSPGMRYLLDLWLKNELAAEIDMDSLHQIKPLVVTTLDSLIYSADIIKFKSWTINELFEAMAPIKMPKIENIKSKPKYYHELMKSAMPSSQRLGSNLRRAFPKYEGPKKLVQPSLLLVFPKSAQ